MQNEHFNAPLRAAYPVKLMKRLVEAKAGQRDV
jgi:hypothetical protein